MHEKATFDQASQVLELIKQQGPPKEQLQRLFASGFLSDLLSSDASYANRHQFLRALGISYVTLRNAGKIVSIPELEGKSTIRDAGYIFSIIADGFEIMERIQTATPHTNVGIYSVRKEGSGYDLFGSVDEDFLKLTLTPSQIRKFCFDHQQWISSVEGSIVTLFLVRVNSAEGELCVVSVRSLGRVLHISHGPFDNRGRYTLDGGPIQIVVPVPTT